MSIGIKEIGTYLPERRISNIDRAELYGIGNDFIEKKIGIKSVSRIQSNETASQMCIQAMENLLERFQNLDLQKIDFLCVCTENPDYQIPFTAALVHDSLGLSMDCAAFDINLGCSGYVYSLEIARTFMEANGLRKGLVFTADPYSQILDSQDKNTELLFGDGATVTLLSDDPLFHFGKGTFKTIGNLHAALTKKTDEPLVMDGRGIYNFVLRYVPGAIMSCLNANDLSLEDVDIWLLHQASRFMVESLAKKMKLSLRKVPFEIQDYGNTVSSSIPLLLQNHLTLGKEKILCLSGFGVGLSISTHILKRI